MAKGLNKVFLLGGVGKDPEIRATQSGSVVASFSLATSDREKGADGQWTDKTEWHNLVAFARTAEVVRDYVKKGTQILVEGKIQTRSWDDKNSGEKKYKTEILVNELTLLGGKSEGGSPESGRSQTTATRTASSAGTRTQSTAAARGVNPQITDADLPDFGEDDPF